MKNLDEIYEKIEALSRLEIIDLLIEADQSFRFDDYFSEWFETILHNGFKGYRHQTDEQLAAELAERVARGQVFLD